MELNKEKVFELMNKYCGGNYNRFARTLGVDPAHLYRFINTGVGGGKKLVGAIMKFCKEYNLDFEDYIQFV
ncbi:MAG: XRE family transcriptional regulator [Acetivibrionales bacterium]